jgi:hypothetical protein
MAAELVVDALQAARAEFHEQGHTLASPAPPTSVTPTATSAINAGTCRRADDSVRRRI